MEILTKKQGEILDFIKVYVANHGYPPTVREIAKKLKVNSPATIHSHLNKLVEKKYIKKDDSKNRAIELLVDNEYLNKNESIVSIPLLGNIKAGLPIEAIENTNDFFDVPSYFSACKTAQYAPCRRSIRFRVDLFIAIILYKFISRRYSHDFSWRFQKRHYR